MNSKRIVVLANSIKKRARCVAGREAKMGKTLEVGAWCRPISEESEGELQPKHITLTGGSVPQPLQIVDVPVKSHAGDTAHPEDWVITGDAWTLVGTCPAEKLHALVEEPASLWLEAGIATDRVRPDFLKGNRQHQSLYLVRPQDFRIRYWQEFNPHKGRTQRRSRALFTYAGVEYDMSLTDPVASDQYCKDYPNENQAPKEIKPPFGDNCVLCVSLTPAFKGFHYKVVATVLALP